MKTIYLLRHAKSDWESDFETDHERGLAPRGVKASKMLAKYWDDYGFHVDACYVSDAKRCVDTWEILSDYGEFAEYVTQVPSIYEADVDDLIEMIKMTPDSLGSLLLIGHNPGLEELAEYLVVGEYPDGELHNPLFTKFPTAAFLGVSLSVDSWKDVSPGHGSVIVYWIPGRKGR